MDRNIFRPFDYYFRTWAHGAAAFRDELTHTSLDWTKFGFAGPCPFPVPSNEELAIHQERFEQYKTSVQLRDHLVDALNVASDGWVSANEWDNTKALNKELFDHMVQSIREVDYPEDKDDLSQGSARDCWPFDVD
ncbi:hypothetical protein G7Y89_g8274 [Cudoniella acicularis]|uniref:Uncharacterized protein n=1 Tax=Cudoniella acicularis TaxID=354080 RepID=A0A8H4RGX7_9HELO|nr:hypothetical protein G7Y89_g8274 [Cudoniella acicularis]